MSKEIKKLVDLEDLEEMRLEFVAEVEILGHIIHDLKKPDSTRRKESNINRIERVVERLDKFLKDVHDKKELLIIFLEEYE